MENSITTKEFNLDRKTYFLLSLRDHFRSNWLYYVGIIIIAIGSIFASSNGDYDYIVFMLRFLLLIGPYSLLWMILGIWITSNNPENKFYFLRTHYEINDEFLSSFSEDGSYEKVALKRVTKARKYRNYYLLNTSQHLFHYIPLSAFYSTIDLERFEVILRSKKLLK